MKTLTEPFSETRTKLIELRHLSYPQIAAQLGYSRGAIGFLSDVVHGRYEHVKEKKLNDLRSRLELPPVPPSVTAYPCPSCGQLHQVDDCHNTPGTVALIPAGARIIPPSKRKRAPYRRPTWAMVRAMQADLDDWHASMQAALDPCADEQHCACVPHLRRHIAELEAQLEALHDPHP